MQLKNPIKISNKGIHTKDTFHEVDVIIYATGFKVNVYDFLEKDRALLATVFRFH